MKTILTTLILIMLFTACAEKERYAERYLDSIGLVIHADRPAEVTGLLRQGASPTHAIEYPDLSGVSRLSFSCCPSDSAKLLDRLSDVIIPFSVTGSAYDGHASVEFWQDGITWQPEYSWTVDGDSCLFSAAVQISNSTGREWFSRSIVMKDPNEVPVCMVSDTLIIRNGDMELGWWSARGEALPLTLSYGWPVNSQWNQMIPCIVPESGDLLTEAREWPIRTDDTLWIQPEQQIEMTETIHQNTTGYECTLQIYNQTEEYTEIRITHPDITPRGAKFLRQGDFPSFIGLQPGDVVILEYRITYNHSS